LCGILSVIHLLSFAPLHIRQMVFTFLLHLAGFHPSTLLSAGILAWTNTTLLQCLGGNNIQLQSTATASSNSSANKLEHVPLLMSVLKFLSHLLLSFTIQTQQSLASEILTSNTTTASLASTSARKPSISKSQARKKILMKIPFVQLGLICLSLFPFFKFFSND
jgi:hypothetical protein